MSQTDFESKLSALSLAASSGVGKKGTGNFISGICDGSRFNNVDFGGQCVDEAPETK